MENVFEGAIILLIGLAMSFLAVVAIFSAVLVLSTIPKRDRD
jgi:hypothetical protein